MSYTINARAVNAAPPPRPTRQEFSGVHLDLLLCRDNAADFKGLYQNTHGDADKESVWDYLPYGPFPDADAMRAAYAAMGADGDPRFHIVRHKADSSLAGIISYLRIAPDAYSIEIGHIWHAVSAQRGYANTEAAFLLIDHAFALGYRRMEWKCNALNDRSRRAALRLGFAFEGVFRQHLVAKGKNRDTAWFSIIDRDWGALRENYQRWLAAERGTLSLAEMNLPFVEWSLPAHDAWKA